MNPRSNITDMMVRLMIRDQAETFIANGDDDDDGVRCLAKPNSGSSCRRVVLIVFRT